LSLNPGMGTTYFRKSEDLLSSALDHFTSVFEMGTGGTSPV